MRQLRLTAFADSQWAGHYVDGGTECINTGSEQGPAALDVLRRLISGEIDLDSCKELGEGNNGTVYAVGGFAVKRFLDWTKIPCRLWSFIPSVFGGSL
jgi:hypothetical protein